MTASRIVFILAFATLGTAASAAPPAPAPTSIPEPSDVGLLAMGIAGVAIGRWMHARRARRDQPGDRDE